MLFAQTEHSAVGLKLDSGLDPRRDARLGEPGEHGFSCALRPDEGLARGLDIGEAPAVSAAAVMSVTVNDHGITPVSVGEAVTVLDVCFDLFPVILRRPSPVGSGGPLDILGGVGGEIGFPAYVVFKLVLHELRVGEIGQIAVLGIDAFVCLDYAVLLGMEHLVSDGLDALVGGQLGKTIEETQAVLHNSAQELFRQNRHIRHLYLLGNDNVWYYYLRGDCWGDHQLDLYLPLDERHKYKVFIVQKARTGEETQELVAYETAQCPEEAAYLAAREYQLYRNNLVATQCAYGEEYLLGRMLKRWTVADKNKQHKKPAFWNGLAVAEDEALAIAKACWQNRTVLDVDRGYRWCNPEAECVSAAV